MAAKPPQKLLRFNSQPPEGGWQAAQAKRGSHHVSTHSRPKAAGKLKVSCLTLPSVSTHSRPKAAGGFPASGNYGFHRFNSQPPEGGWGEPDESIFDDIVSTHSRPKAAGGGARPIQRHAEVSTHSRPKAAGKASYHTPFIEPFQLTAARRRLARPQPRSQPSAGVSTHSRPKAAGDCWACICVLQ